jgi:hypothetical protein
MVSRFTWTQLKNFEIAALKARVPENVPGLVPRAIASNAKWMRRSTTYERNGETSVCGNLWMIRTSFFVFVTCCLYQQWRILTFGWTEFQEHHSYNFDNLIYDKQSTRCIPYHSPEAWP